MKLEALSFSGLTGQQLHHAAKMCILALTLILTSCQNEYMRNPLWSGAPQYQNQYGYQYNQYQHQAYHPARTAAVQQPVYQRQQVTANTGRSAVRTGSVSKVSKLSTSKYLNTSTSRKPKDQSVRVLPPIPSDGYTARWDKTPVTGSPSGGYWVVNSRGQTWYLKTTDFWPFWSGEVWNRRPIRIFDPYNPVASR